MIDSGASALALLIVGLVGYLVGSISSGYIVGRIYRNVDLRKVGSGSTGATNTFRDLSNSFSRQYIRQAREKVTQRRLTSTWFRKILEINRARTRGERIRFDFIELERFQIVVDGGHKY